MAISKEISFGNEARDKIKIGIDKVADAVKTTLGPKGRTVIFRRNWGAPVVTKDGVTVAKEIVLPDYFEDTGAQLCKQVAMKTNDVAGDGTTTATVLAQAIVERGAELIADGLNPVAVKRGIDAATAAAIEYIKAHSTVITLDDKEMVEYIASISGNDPEIGKQVANAFIDVGENGVVTFQEGKSIDTSVEMVEGFQFDRGYASPYLCTDQQKMKVELENVKVLLWEKPITNAVDLAPLLEQAAVAKVPLAIIADEIGGDALGTLVINVMRGVIRAVAVRAPGFGERRKGLMQDMALMTGGTFFDESLGYKLDKVKLEQLGTIQRIVVNSDSCVLVGGVGDKDKVEAHIESLKNLIAESDSKYDIEKYQERIAKLSSGVAVIKIGAHNESEMGEKKYRYEDAVSATRAALEMGIVSGGGVTLINAARKIKKAKVKEAEEQAGWKILVDSLKVPFKTILANGGCSEDSIEKKLARVSGKIGYDAKTNSRVDMMAAGIIDPTKVTISALENAAAIAGLFLMTEAMIVDTPSKDQQPDMMGGMM